MILREQVLCHSVATTAAAAAAVLLLVAAHATVIDTNPISRA